MKNWELAQLNIATTVAPLDSPVMADFVGALDRINAMAEASPGFVWRLQSPEGNATSLEHDFGAEVIPNLSVWRSVEDLHHYVYRSAHVEIMKRRKEWFQRMRSAYTVLWWVPEGHRPTLWEASLRLTRLHTDGPGPDAFTFKQPFAKPGETDNTPSDAFDDQCPAF